MTEHEILSASQRKKVAEIIGKCADCFLAMDLIQYIGGKFVCNPIPGYNKTPHVMERKEGGWTCTCQGFRMKERAFCAGLSPNPPFCSHLLALMHAFREKRFGNQSLGEGADG